MGKVVVVLDGKTVRAGLNRELDYSPADRAEHLRRVAHICKLLNDQGIICIASFISPKESIRQQVKEIIGPDRFKLVYMDADIDYCRKNDKYGLYKLADEGKLNHLAGVDEEFEVPEKDFIKVKQGAASVEKVIAEVDVSL